MTQAADSDQTSTAGRLVQSVMLLAKAEIKLAIAETRAVAKEAAIAVALSWASLSLVQVTLVLIAVLPVLAGLRSWSIALLSIAPCLVLTIAVGILAAQRWRRVSALAGARQAHKPDASASVSSTGPEYPVSPYPGAYTPGSLPPEMLRPSETRSLGANTSGLTQPMSEGDHDARAERNFKAG